MAVKAQLLGREALYRKLRQLVPNAETELAAAQLEGATTLAGRIRPRAPRHTGRYQASIIGDRLANHPSKKPIGPRATKDPNATGIFADFRWRWLEFGTVYMPARPHIFPTYRAYKKRLRRLMANAVNRAVRKVKA